ncbi:MAG TPA: TrbC/VirB2 family protein [Candidatus Paceibacterota bacterium]|nr:TrbC/VirB2 family protein [Candidatus Paceibacterota bacterium]
MKKFLPVVLLSLMVLPLFVSAAVDPEIAICNILNKIKVVVAALGFGLAVIFLIVGGIQYMTAGGDDEKASKAKKLIINAIIGIAIIFAATFILSLVEGLLIGGGITPNPFGNPCGSY